MVGFWPITLCRSPKVQGCCNYRVKKQTLGTLGPMLDSLSKIHLVHSGSLLSNFVSSRIKGSGVVQLYGIDSLLYT